MKKALYKRRISRILAAILLFLAVMQPFSVYDIYAGESILTSQSDSRITDTEEKTSADAGNKGDNGETAALAEENTGDADAAGSAGEGESEAGPLTEDAFNEQNAGALSYDVIFYKYDNTNVLKEYSDIPANTKFKDVEGGITAPATEHTATNEKFKYWYDSKTEEKYNYGAESEVTGNLSFYQLWVKIWTVEFDSNGGSQVDALTEVEDGSTITPPSVSRNNYEFDGWYTESDLVNKFNFNTTAIEENKTLYAKWIPKYTVTFSMGDYAAEYNGEKTQSVVSGNYAKEPGSTPRKTDYTFTGWYTKKDGGELFNFNSTKIENNITLYAHFTVNTYTVKFMSDNKLVKSQSVNGGTKISRPVSDTEMTKEGKIFRGWVRENSETAWDFTDQVHSDMTLTATWDPVMLTVEFNENGVTNVINMPKSQTIDWGSVIAEPDPAPSHTQRDFLGWYTDKAGEGDKWEFPHTVSGSDVNGEKGSNKIILYAKWKYKSFKVDFYIKGEAMPISSQEVLIGKKPDKPDVSEPEHKLLDGWYKNENLRESEKYNFGNNSTDIVTEDIKLYGQWKDANIVTLNTNGGSAISPVKVISGNKLIESSLITEKEGYELDGWYKDSLFNEPWNFDDEIHENTTLYAKWKLSSYKVTFINEGETFDVQTVTYNGLIDKPNPDPQKNGYDFDGWFLDKNGTPGQEWDFENRKISANNITLYACYKIKSYTVTFEIDNTEIVKPGPQIIEYNNKAGEPDVTMPGGLKIEGWYIDGKFKDRSARWDFDTDVVTKDITLKANIIDRSYAVTFETNGGSRITPNPQNVSYEGYAIEPRKPVKSGYVFSGWYKEATFENIFVFSENKITQDITVYAKWEDAPTFKIKASAADSNGTIFPSGEVNVKQGDSKSFTISPKAGYQVDVLKIDGVVTEFEGTEYTFENVTEEHSITVSFKEIPVIRHTISAGCADSYGMISPSGEVSVVEGNDRTFYFEALDGYELDRVEIDGEKADVSGNSYTFENVTAGHTITVYFKEKKVEPFIPTGYALIKFVVDDEVISSEIVSIGQVLSKPADPVKTGQVFLGWYNGNWKWNFSDAVKENMTLTARFMSNTVSPGDVHSGLDEEMNISDPNDITMVKGQSYKFGAGIWESSDTGVISIGKKNGVARAKNQSLIPVTIRNTAVLPAVTYKVKVVAPEMSDKTLTLGVGTSEKLTLLYADGMNIAWRSSNVKTASVEEGVVTAKARGNARITAYVNGKGYNCTVKVTDKYTAPTTFDDVNSFTIRPTQTLNLKNVAVNGVKPNKLDWRLSDESGSRDVDKSGWKAWDDGIVRIDVNGKLTAKACGSSTVIGKTGDHRTKTVRVNVSTIPSKTETYINVGRNERLSYYKVNNSKASWSATGVGEIVQLGSTGGSKGRVYGLKPGTSVVTCSYNGMVYSTTVHVERPELASGNGLFKVKANEYMLTLKSGTRFVLDMPEVVQTITWKSADKKKAFVDERGIVEGRNTGITTVSTKINGTLVKVKVYVLQ